MLSPKKSAIAEDWKKVLPLFGALTAAGLTGNYLRYPLFFNIDYLFGSIFAMLALQVLGPVPGVLSAFFISCMTYHVWNHPYAIVIMTLEVLAVSLLVQRKRVGLVVADTIYWLCVGVPLVYFFYHIIMHLPASTVHITMMKQAVNGVANALIARLVFIVASFRTKKSFFPLQEVVFNLLTLFVLVPALILVAIDSKSEFTRSDTGIRQSLISASERVSFNLDQWLRDHVDTVVYLAGEAGTVPLQRMQQSIDQIRRMDGHFLRLGLIDGKANAVAFSPRTDELGRNTIGLNFSDRPFIPVIQRTLQPMLSEVYMGKVGVPQPVVSIVAPVVRHGHYDGYAIGVLDLHKVREQIALNALSPTLKELHFTLVDRNNKMIAADRPELALMAPYDRGPGEQRPLGDGISQWLSPARTNVSISERWGDSLYIREIAVGIKAEWRLILEQPVRPFQEKLYAQFAARLTLVFLVLLAALGLAHVLSQGVVRSLKKLKDLSSGLPAKLSSGSETAWPRSTIRETEELVENFKDMSRTLAVQFREITNMNITLEERVRERTKDLIESEKRYRLLAENTTDVVWQFDLRTNRYTYISPSVRQLRGYTPEEVIARPLEASLTPESLRRVQGWIAEAVGEFAAGRINTKQQLRELEQPRKDGSTVWTEVSTTYILDEQNRPISIVGISRDITERRQAEDAIREREEKYKLLLDATSTGYVIIDDQGLVLDANKEYVRLSGHGGLEDILGRPVTEWTAEHDLDRNAREVQLCLEKGMVRNLTIDYVDKLGSITPVEINASVLQHGRSVRIFSVCRDIAERRRAEESVRRTLREKETLLREIHHRVKNNLQVISGLLDLQSQKIEDAGLRTIFQESQRRVKSMAIVHEKMYQTKSLEAIDFHDYVSTIVGELSSFYNTTERHITTTFDVGHLMLNLDLAIPCALIINELLTNTYKHAFLGRENGEVRIGFHETDGSCTLSVADNGIGLPGNLDWRRTTTLGYQLFSVLVKQLRGTVDVAAKDGVLVTITFKRAGTAAKLQ